MKADLAHAGGPIACAGLALLLVATRRDLRIGGLAAWLVGCAFLALYLAPSGHTKVYGAAVVFGALAAVGLAALFRRWPWLIAVGALACAPARIPVHVGATDSNLLLPLYAVVAGAAVLLGFELVRGDARTRELGPLTWPLAALIAWTGLSLAWTEDLHEGAIALLFFWLPFGLLALSLARLAWNRRWLAFLCVQLIGMAIAFSFIGVYQYATRDVFWNPKVIVGNAYAPFYRVNSVFYDPSVYGRFLVVAILTALVIALYDRNRNQAFAAAAAICAIWVGLLFSFSQSSFVALIAGTLLAATVVWRWRAAAVLGLVAAVLITVGFATPQVRNSLLDESKSGLDKYTSGRAGLVSNGLKIAADHPLAGVGTGGFKLAYAERTGLRGREPKKAASHSTPVTVAAEAGVPGVLLLGWLCFAALAAALGAAGRSEAGRTAIVAGLTLAAIAVHSLFYNALFEDPMAWALLGFVALAVARRGKEATA
jgi:O-antigen ligase